MDKKIYNLAKELKKKYKKIDVISLISELQNHGYDTVFFNTQKGDELLRIYGLSRGNSKAFTYCGITKIVFVDNLLHVSDKICVLLHELGHIKLEHIGNNNSKYIDACISEIEADAYAYEVLSKGSSTFKKIIVSIVVLITILSLSFLLMWGCKAKTETEAKNINMVYITSSGKRYHKQNCVFISNSDISALNITEAQKCFSPCKYCIETIANNN